MKPSPPRRNLAGRALAVLISATCFFENELHRDFYSLASQGRLDLAEICCTPDSPLSACVNSSGGSAERFSFWNGFDLASTTGTNRLIHELKKKKPKWLWMSPPCDPWPNSSGC